ncbi:MAG: metallophosphoesterase [Parabacteroides sp.]|nr:metallophosphoesterase [Parabacteroides sp.]
MKTCLLSLLLLLSYCFTSVAQSVLPKEDNSIRILSYNVRNGKGMDNTTDYQRVADVINRIAPDVVAVQELDSVTQRNNGVYSLGELAQRTLMHATYAGSIDYQGGKYGIGMLSKEKPVSYKRVPLPGREEKRSLLLVEFADYVVCCTHFSLTEEDQQASVELLVTALEGIRKPVFLAGDMNSEYDSQVQAAMRKNFTTLNNPKQFTFPSDKPKECIDFIYQLNNGKSCTVLNRQVIAEPVASDHLPLFVDIRFPAKASDILRTTPFLQNPVGNGITVSWMTNVPTHSWVEYGTDAKLGLTQQTVVDGQVIANNKHHKIRLNNLKPGITYYYRVCSREITLYEAYKKEFGETAYSEIQSFTLPRNTESDFTALIFNDLHKNKDLMDKLSNVVKDIDYDFVFFNGDCIDDPKNEAQAVDFISYINRKVKADRLPVFFLRGNHEIRNAYSIQLRNLFDYVGDRTYGAFNWGDTRFVMLDCGEDKPDSTSVYYNLNNFDELRKDQAAFLQTELAGKAFRSAAKRVLIHHIPIYGMKEERFNPCLELWGKALTKAPFNVAINAHMHRFEWYPKGTADNYFPVVVGGGNNASTGTVMILRKKGSELSLEVLDAAGKVLRKEIL